MVAGTLPPAGALQHCLWLCFKVCFTSNSSHSSIPKGPENWPPEAAEFAIMIKRRIKFIFWRLAICNWFVLTYAHSRENRSALQYTVDAATLPPDGALRHCSRVRFKVCFSTETFQLVLWHCEHDICGKKEVLAYSELLMLKHIIYKKWTQKVHNLAFFPWPLYQNLNQCLSGLF